ncbi:MAG: hypothetical protein ACI80K_001990 [Paracoccaceae bacterium]|jgi:hypothetical protein
MEPKQETEDRFDDGELNLSSAVDSIKAFQKQRILQWCLRSAITGTFLWWLSTMYSWVGVIFYIWATIAALSLIALVFLPSLVGNRIQAMQDRMTESVGFGGLPNAPRDVETMDVEEGGDDTPLLEAPDSSSSVPEFAPVPLEEQLAELERFGIRLHRDASVDDLCHSFNREFLESDPYDALLFLMGSEVEREPYGRHFSDAAWAFDSKCIGGDGSYVAIVQNIARISGKKDQLEGLQDSVDLDAGSASLEYTLAGQKRQFQPVVNSDWADPATIQGIIDQFADGDIGFYGISNGQGTIIYCLKREDAVGFEALVPQEVMEIA